MESLNPNDLELVRRMIRQELSAYYAPFPARIATMNQTAQTADLVPWRAGMGMLRDVPIVVPASTAARDTIKLAAGDWVLCIPCMFSLDEFLGTDRSGPVEPADPRQQDMTDVMAIPMLRSPSPDLDARNADRAIEGSTVAIGDATSATALLRGPPTFITDWAAFVDAIEAGVLAANAGTYIAGAVLAAAPTLLPTTNLKGS